MIRTLTKKLWAIFTPKNNPTSEWLREVAQIDATAQYKLALRYVEGEGVPKDIHKSAALFHMAAIQGHTDAECILGTMYYSGGIAVPYDFLKCLGFLKSAADKENMLAIAVLKKILLECETAAQQGDSEAQFRLGAVYLLGAGVPRDGKEGIKWYRLAAEQGHVKAQIELKLCLDAIYQDHIAAEQGDAESQNRVGVYYADGVGVSQDQAEAFKWHRLAAEQGHAIAQINVGSSYEHGEGVTEDHAEALKWYSLAAEQGHAVAQFDLGNCYYNGVGVRKDHVEAVKWYQLAAEQGHGVAQLMLGIYYSDGSGELQNIVTGHMWFTISATSQNKDAEECLNLIELNMTPEQIAEAQKMSRKWLEKCEIATDKLN